MSDRKIFELDSFKFVQNGDKVELVLYFVQKEYKNIYIFAPELTEEERLLSQECFLLVEEVAAKENKSFFKVSCSGQSLFKKFCLVEKNEVFQQVILSRLSKKEVLESAVKGLAENGYVVSQKEEA
ncbi:MAG TPA: hypothetical protein VKP03_01815 [Patescibacteria group bacterium]|nr:hypothetical protein [Patescibacteria group bacterium]